MRKRLSAALATILCAVTAAAALVVTRPTAAGAATGGFDFTHPQVAATGLLTPWGMAFLPDASVLVTQRATAEILRVYPGGTSVRVTTVPGVLAMGEGGLLGIALSPTFLQDLFVYVYFTTAYDNRVARFRWGSPDVLQVVLAGIPRGQADNGGRIAFGPDGMLYVATGDAGNAVNAQNLNSLGGKILRIRPDGSLPPDNPFTGLPVYSYGHRNVQGLAWDAGGRLYATEFGEDAWDEINYIVPGGNYGWPACQGVCGDTRFRGPVVTWRPADASPSGLAYANGTLFAAALRGTRLWTVPAAGGGAGTPVAELQGTYGRLRTVAVGPDGWLWVATSNRDGRGTPVLGDDRIIRIPPAAPTGNPSPSPSVSPSPSTSPSPSPSPSASPSPPAGTRSCEATIRIVSLWPGGFRSELTVRNTGTLPISSWTVTFGFPKGEHVVQLWNGRYTQSGATVTVTNESWNGALAPGQSVTVGFDAGLPGGTVEVPTPITCTAT
ncbi:PQQ-dependent sugar dehydrogenase [Microbispora sp. CA-102843]|uniref:PQQ-dependent sugar dehydrogenase n=1 Tax=Microbispora sp. CA-102843 TaxID=3239952 RepID=UPI003D92A894